MRSLGILLLATAAAQCGTSAVTAERNRDTVDPALRMLIEDRTRVAAMQEQAARDASPFEVQVDSDGRVVVPVFITTTDPDATAAAIRQAGGTVSVVMKGRLIAGLPIGSVASVGERSEVVRIEPSWKRRG
jgi:hypothetical protein